MRREKSQWGAFTNTEVSNIKLTLSGGGGNFWQMTELAAVRVTAMCILNTRIDKVVIATIIIIGLVSLITRLISLYYICVQGIPILSSLVFIASSPGFSLLSYV